MAYQGGHGSDSPFSERQIKIPVPSMTKISREQFEQKINAFNELQEKYNRLLDEVEQLRTSKAKLEVDLRNARAIQVRMESESVEEDVTYRLLQEKIDETIEELTTARSIQVRLESMCKKKDVSFKLVQEKLDRRNAEVETLRDRIVEMEKRSTGSEATYKGIQEKYEEAENKVRDVRANLSRMESTCKEKDTSYKMLQEKFDRIMTEVKTLRARQVEHNVAYERLQKKYEEGDDKVKVNVDFYKHLQQKYSEEMNKRTLAAGCFRSWKAMGVAHKEVEISIMQSISEKYTEIKQRDDIVTMIKLHMDLCLENRKENQPDIFLNGLIERRAEMEYLKKMDQLEDAERKNHMIAAKIAEDYWGKNKYEHHHHEEEDLQEFLKNRLERINS